MAKGMRSTAIHRDELGGATIGMGLDHEGAVPLRELNPERAARRILNSLVGGAGDATIAATEEPSAGAAAEYKSLGVETIPFTDTQAVKFRQQFHKIPVYGSLVTVELDRNNNFMAVNSSIGEPTGVDPVATLSPAQAIERVRQWAGYGDRPLVQPARLNFYFDQKGDRWRLVYVIEDVLRYSPRVPQATEGVTALPEYSDFVLDAHTGEPRRRASAHANHGRNRRAAGRGRQPRCNAPRTGGVRQRGKCEQTA